MSSAEQHPEALDLVINADGSGVVDASQLARLGLQPGTHLRVVADQVPPPQERRRNLFGVLANTGPVPTWEDFEAASEAVTRDLEARYRDGGPWDSLSR
jgi:hypothetical protein